MAHLFQSAVGVFFWLLGAMFIVGIVGSAFVVILTSIEDVKELRDYENGTRNKPEAIFTHHAEASGWKA